MKVIRAAGEFYWARSAYFIANDQHGRGEGLSEAAEAARLAAGVYRAALDELRVRLLSSQRSAEDAAEVGRVSKLITMSGDEAG